MQVNNRKDIIDLLIAKHDQYNSPEFILSDPIQVPHSFSTKEDIEIAAFLTAAIAWGNRASIIKSANSLMDRMDRAPYEFIRSSDSGDIEQLDGFAHRTFNSEDMAWLIHGLHKIYTDHGGLETVFTEGYRQGGAFGSLSHFRKVFISFGVPGRSGKHISDVEKGSAAKRLNLFLMWMVRNDRRGVHFGLWDGISTADLMIPLDTHVGRVARSLGLLKRKTNDWQSVEELTAELRKIDPEDPCKFDFSLFGLGLFDHF
ncbi:MAG: TIGR02757 family protein [Bacteroidia bacterium]|nr:TIGR02757 family protein [Bacteroidia bacterium]